MSDLDRDARLRSDEVGHQAEVAVGRDEGEDPLRLPSFESHARVEAGVVEQAGVHEGHAQIGHPRQLHDAVDLKFKQVGNNGMRGKMEDSFLHSHGFPRRRPSPACR